MTNFQREAKVFEKAQTRAEAAREDAAKQLLSWDAVAAEIGNAAGKGLGRAVFTPSAGVDLRKAPAALATIERLRGGGFATEWQPRREAPDAPDYYALAVSW